MVCHDIKNPSSNIIKLTQLLKIKSFSKFEPEEQEIFELIYQAGYQITNIVDSLRTLSDIKRRKYMEYEEVNLSDIVQQILSEYQNKTPEHQAEFMIKPDIIMTGNRQLLQIGLEKLLENAWKYSSKKEKTIVEFGTITKQRLIENEVDISPHILEHLDENETIYFLQDNGVGFPQEKADKIFQIFHRLHTQEEFEGTGIGLAIVQNVIDAHDGKIWCHGKVDEGATFYFSINRACDQGKRILSINHG